MQLSSENPLQNKQSKLYGLDHLRALAILLVLIYHYGLSCFDQPLWVLSAGKFGWTGVDLFFVLSGFLISSQLFVQIKSGKQISLREFFLKRFFRILPAFWVVLLIYFWIPGFHEREGLPPFWKFLTFTQNFGLNIGNHSTFSQVWSLCVEEHFYLLLPLILLFLLYTNLFKRSVWLLAGIFLFGFGIRFFIWEHFVLPDHGLWYQYIYYPTYNRLDGLLIGVAIAGLVHFRPVFWERISGFGNHFILLSMLVLTGAWFLCSDQHSFSATILGFPLVSLGYGLLVMGAISPNSFLYRWQSKSITLIATLSYAIYLTHKGIIHVIQLAFKNFDLDTNTNLMLVVCAIACLFGALALNLAVEKPFMRWRNYIISEIQNKRLVAKRKVL